MSGAKKGSLFCPSCGGAKYANDGTSESKYKRYRCSTKGCGRRFTENTAAKSAKVAAKVKQTGNPDVATAATLTTEARQRQELLGLRAQVKELAQESVDTQRLRTLIHGVKETSLNPPKWLARKKSTTIHGTPTLFLSDLHWGERVFPSQVNGCNEYNLVIARQRLKRVITSSVRLLRDYLTGGEYDGFVLPLGGDLLSGNIHEELRETNDAQILTCVVDLYENLVPAIELLADEFGRVFVPCVVGNHGRMDKKPRAKGAARDNFEWILFHFLYRHFKNDKRVTIVVSESLDYLYKVHNTTYLLTHGDQFRGGSGISGPMTPWALGDHRKRKRQDAIKQPYDVMIFGHWHQLFWGNGTFIANGSLKGYDEYAFRSNFSFQSAQQALWITHPDKGITFQMPVLADEISEPEATSWVSVPG